MASDDELNALLRLSFDDAPYGISIVDIHGRQLAGNAVYAEMIGRSIADLDGLDVGTLTRDADLGWTANYLRRLVTGEVPYYATDKIFVQPDGSERMLRLTAWPLRRDGECVAVIGTLQPSVRRTPLTDARTRKLIENIDNTITLVDADGALIETSGRYRPILGYPAEFWENRTIFDLLHPDDAVRVLELRESVLREPGHLLSGDFLVRSAQGDYEPIHVNAVNLLDDPDVRGIVITSRNVAAERAMVRELAARSETAEGEAMVRSRMIATVSHELRNPLHAMSGLAELLATGNLEPQMAALANTLHRQIVGLGGVLDDLLESSRLDAAGVTLRTNSVTLAALLSDVVALTATSVGERPIAVSYEIASDVPAVIEADASRLRQVLSNLMGNAAKFTERGSVSVAASTTPDGQLCFTINDTGRGIPPADLDRIFEPFVAAGNAGNATGAGLGLTIVRQLVAAMRGTITATSTLGHGSEFRVVLPLTAIAAGEPSPAPLPGSTARSTVLVVEDNDVNQLLARGQLERLGLDCVMVGTGEAALELLADPSAPRVVLMDFQLPGIDGLETTRRYRAMEAASGIGRRAIIGVTASAMAADRVACAEAGLDDFLPKPVSLTELGEMLQKWLPSSMAAVAPSVDGHTPDDDATECGVGRDEGAIDADVLDELVSELNPEMVRQLVATYLGELDRRRDGISAAAAAGDREAAQRGAHTLKASSLLLGAAALGAVCRELEHLDDAARLPALAAQVQRLAASAGEQLNDWLQAQEVAR